MLVKFQNTPMNRDVYRYVSNRDTCVTLEDLEKNQYREPNIKIADIDTYIGGYGNQIGIYTYVAYQALSKILTCPLHVTSCTTQSPDTVIRSDLNRFKESVENSPDFHVHFMGMAPSNYTHGVVNTFKTEFGTFNKDLDQKYSDFTERFLYGRVVSDDKRKIIIFCNYKRRIDILNQLKTIALIYRSLDTIPSNTVTHGVHDFFYNLTSYLANKRYKDDTKDLDNLHNIFLAYIMDQVEYKIDKVSVIEKIIRGIREKRFNDLEYKVSNARSKLQNALNNLATVQKEFNEYNELYTLAMKETDENLHQTITEANDLLTRSKVIVEHGFDDTKLWFDMRQPLYINNKDEWARIENRVVTQEKLRELLHKVFIDEQYELYTSCSVFLNLEDFRIGRYKAKLNIPNTIGHPHIAAFSCFGQHSNIIGNLLAKADVLGAIEQAIEAGSGLNWSDGPVINRFINSFTTGEVMNCTCFKDPKTNNWFSYMDYIGKKENESN